MAAVRRQIMKTQLEVVHPHYRREHDVQEMLKRGLKVDGYGPSEAIMKKTYIMGGEYEVDVTVYNGKDGPWVDAVLFDNGMEICTCEPGSSFFGEYNFHAEDAEHVVHEFTLILRSEEVEFGGIPVGMCFSGLMRDLIVESGLANYPDALELSTRFDRMVKQCRWIDAYDGTTFNRGRTQPQ